MATIAYNVDCMEYMRSLPDKAFDLAVVDPPYGLKITGSTHTHTQARVGSSKPFGSKGDRVRGMEARIICTKFYPVFDDDSPPDAEYFRELERVAKRRIIWGGNFFLEHLGPASCMIVWDKERRGLVQADCEIAWTDLPGQSRVFRFKWNGMLQENMKNKEIRIHATQKPVALYAWLYSRYAKPGDRILDTHLGSGSSRIAAYDAALEFVGTEISKEIFDLQEERFEAHAAQENLFLQAELPLDSFVRTH